MAMRENEPVRKDSEGSGSSGRGFKTSARTSKSEKDRPKALSSAAASIVGNTPKNGGAASIVGTPKNGGFTPPPDASTSSTSLSCASAESKREAFKKSKSNVMEDFDVGVMNGADAAGQWAAPKPGAADRGSISRNNSLNVNLKARVSRHESVGGSGGSDSGESDNSRASHISIKDLRKSLKESRKGDIKGDAESVRLHLDDCTVEADKEVTAGRWKSSSLTDFSKLCAAGRHRDGLAQGLEMYGMKAPNRCQEHLIPVLLYFLGKNLEGMPDEKGPVRSMVAIQGKQSGKTSSAVLASLAVVDPSIQKPQAILVSRSSKQEINKFLRVIALAHSDFKFQAFEKDETGLDLDIDPASPEVVAARTAHVLVGHPGRLRKALSSGAEIPLDGVKVLVVDDAHELFHGTTSDADTSPRSGAATEKAASEMCLSGLPSGEKRGAVEKKEGAVEKETSSAFATSAIEDVVEICRILDAAGVVKIPYMVIAEESGDKASKKMFKMLKNSMTSKKNLLSVESCTPPMKLIRAMKHYYAESPSTDWVQVFAGLVQALTFPRALIYCDDDRIHQYFREMQSMGIAVSANLPGATADVRRTALSDFSSNKTQFFLTHSEPAVCQIMLPKVSCVFHFGIMSSLPSVYGVRLSPLDEQLKKESASILLVEQDTGEGSSKGKASKEPKSGDAPPVIAKLQKMFSISFLDMPLEMLPARGGRK